MKNKFEQEFQKRLESEKISASRTLCVLGTVLYALFALADFYSLSTTLTQVLYIRGGVVAILLLGVAFTYSNVFIKYYDLALSFVYIACGVGILAMIYLSSSSDHAFNVYFSGLILVIVSVFAWSYFKLFTSIIVVSIIVGLYAYVGFNHQNLSLPALSVNNLFLLSGAAIGFLSQVIRDSYLRENFKLQQTLKNAVNKKTIEANDYAYKANHDALTALPNRRYMIQLLNEGLEVAKEKDKILAILFFDLNGFKPLNDTYGHAVGDEVLTIVAKRLELAIRRGDCVSRLGGDEYLVGLMMDKEHVHEIELMAEKFSAIISEPMNVEGNLVKVGVSVGIAAYPMHGNNVDVLIDIADKKMYKVKQGKGREVKNVEPEPVVVFPGNSRKRR